MYHYTTHKKKTAAKEHYTVHTQRQSKQRKKEQSKHKTNIQRVKKEKVF